MKKKNSLQGIVNQLFDHYIVAWTKVAVYLLLGAGFVAVS